MKHTIYIIFNQTGANRMTKTKPAYNASEYPVVVNITVPDEIFQCRPVPVVEVVLKGNNVGAAEVVVDGESQTISPNMDEAQQKQAAVLLQFASLFERARASSDPAMVEMAGAALDALVAAGVEVRITEGRAGPGGDGGGQCQAEGISTAGS